MLAPIAVMGLVLGCALRYLMTRPVPWAVREGFVTALVLTIFGGMELSLAKFLGSTILVSVVLALCLKYLYPSIARLLAPRS
jgi:small basic protein